MVQGLGEFRKKPVDVLGVKLTEENIREVADWSDSLLVWVGKPGSPARIYVGLDLPTLSGVKRVSFGDFIVKYKSGAFGLWTEADLFKHFDFVDEVVTTEG